MKWVTVSEDVDTFNLDYVIQGDVLLRCRHIDPSGARVSMFRAAFHTGNSDFLFNGWMDGWTDKE